MNIHIEEKIWLDEIASIAHDEGHPYPFIAACEAASASGFGKTFLAVHGHNLYNVPQSAKAEYDTLEMPTREYVDGEWVMNGNAAWVAYPTLNDCLADHAIAPDALAVKRDCVAFAHAAFAVDTAGKVLSIFAQFFPELLSPDDI